MALGGSPFCLALALAAVVALAPASARGLSLVVTPIAVPGGVEIVVGLDAVQGVAGYDGAVSWDETELQLLSVNELLAAGLLPFTVERGTNPRRLAFLVLSFFPTSALFSLTFATTVSVADGVADFSVYLDGVVVSPPGNGVALDGASSGFDLVSTSPLGLNPAPADATLHAFLYPPPPPPSPPPPTPPQPPSPPPVFPPYDPNQPSPEPSTALLLAAGAIAIRRWARARGR